MEYYLGVSSILTLIHVSRSISWWTHGKEAGLKDIWYSKWSHCYKSKNAKILRLKSQFFEILSLQLKKWWWRIKSSEQKGYQKNKYQHGSSLLLILIRKQSCHSQKRKLWMEEPVPNSQSKRKTQNNFYIKIMHKNNAYIMGMRNKQIHVLLCYNHVESYLMET